MARRGARRGARAARAALAALFGVVLIAAVGGALGVEECTPLKKKQCRKSQYCTFSKGQPCSVAANPCAAVQGRKRRKKCNQVSNCQCTRNPSGKGKCGSCVPTPVIVGDPDPSPAPASSFSAAAWLLSGLDGQTGSDTAANLCNGLFKKCYDYTWDKSPDKYSGNTVNCFKNLDQVGDGPTATKYSDFKQQVTTCRMFPPGGSPRSPLAASHVPRPAPRAPCPAPRAPCPAQRSPRPAPAPRAQGPPELLLG